MSAYGLLCESLVFCAFCYAELNVVLNISLYLKTGNYFMIIKIFIIDCDIPFLFWLIFTLQAKMSIITC